MNVRNQRKRSRGKLVRFQLIRLPPQVEKRQCSSLEINIKQHIGCPAACRKGTDKKKTGRSDRICSPQMTKRTFATRVSVPSMEVPVHKASIIRLYSSTKNSVVYEPLSVCKTEEFHFFQDIEGPRLLPGKMIIHDSCFVTNQRPANTKDTRELRLDPVTQGP